MKHILHVVLSLNIGGLERVVIDIAKFSHKDIKPYICCIDEMGAGKAEIEALGINFIELSNFGRNKITSIFKLRTYIIDNNIQLVHAHNEGALLYGGLAAFFSGRPLVFTKHGLGINNVYNRKWMQRILFMMTTKIICVSDDIHIFLDEQYKSLKDKIVSIHNGIDVAKFGAIDHGNEVSIEGVPGLDGDKKIIGIVARLVPDKDIFTLLKAFSLVREKRDDVQLIIVGDGPLRASCISKSEELEISDAVLFLGDRSDVAELMAKMDIFVLSSVSEGLSVTLVEAMAAKLPIVCTDVGGNTEVVDDGITGFIVKSKDAVSMSDKLNYLLDHSEVRKEMGERGYDKAYSQFNVHDSVQEYCKIYHNLL